MVTDPVCKAAGKSEYNDERRCEPAGQLHGAGVCGPRIMPRLAHMLVVAYHERAFAAEGRA